MLTKILPLLLQKLFFTGVVFSTAFAASGVAAPKNSQCQRVFKSGASKPLRLNEVIDAHKGVFDAVRDLRRRGHETEANDLLDKVTEQLAEDDIEKVEYLGGGANDSYKVFFKSGLIAVFKAVNPERKNQIVRETVAYRLSRLLGLDIVPPTVIRKLKGENVPKKLLGVKGSMQLFLVNGVPLEKYRDDSGRQLKHRGKLFNVEDSLSGRRLIVFDWLINNHDRGSNAGNYIILNEDGYIAGIDHSVAFVGHDKKARSDKQPYYKKNFLKDEEFYSRLRSATPAQIAEALEGLNPTRIDEFFIRYTELMDDFKKVLEL